MKHLWFGMCLVALNACGGGGSTGAPAPAVANVAIDGILIGTLTSIQGASTVAIVGVISPDHQLRFVSTPAAQYSGFVNVSGNQISASVIGTAPSGFLFLNGLNTTTGSVNGTVVPNVSLNGTYTAINDSGSFALTYSPTYNRPASLALLTRTWTGAISSGGIATIAVSATGVISGTDTLGCVYAGAVSVIDPTKNIYTATVSVSICSPAATYTGFAILQDFAPGTNNQIDFMVGLSTRSVFGALR